jgi:hypothetical protein
LKATRKFILNENSNIELDKCFVKCSHISPKYSTPQASSARDNSTKLSYEYFNLVFFKEIYIFTLNSDHIIFSSDLIRYTPDVLYSGKYYYYLFSEHNKIKNFNIETYEMLHNNDDFYDLTINPEFKLFQLNTRKDPKHVIKMTKKVIIKSNISPSAIPHFLQVDMEI